MFRDVTTPQPSPSFEFDLENLQIPLYLRSVIIGEDRDAFNHCRHAASRTYRQLRFLQRRRELCYRALCPITNISRYLAHVESLRRLWSWHENSTISYPALAPEPKIPYPAIKFCVSREAYEEYRKEYNEKLEEFMTGVYQKWVEAKEQVEETISKSYNIGNMNWHMWQTFWRSSFLPEMTKWEKYVPELTLPLYDDLIEEIYWAIIQRVEDGERLAMEFWTYGTTTP